MSQKEFIAKLRTEGFGLDSEGRPTGMPEHARASFEQALGVVSKDLYSDDLHFVYELIQNAQDNSYTDNIIPHLKFTLLENDPTNSDESEGCLCVINNEIGFSEKDITSICSAGKSTKSKKKSEGYIGEKGIGFKSVFKVSSFPHIFSNGYNFKLLGNDQLTGLSYIIPYWVEELPCIVKENRGSTCILLPLEKGKYNSIKAALKRHKPEVTLFLDKLKHVEINIPSEGYSVTFKEKQHGEILNLSSEVNNEKAKHQEFLISHKKVYVPEGLHEEKRIGIENRTISVAFPLQKYASLNVFGYLPTEMESGFPFIINADFLLTASRETINNTKWNEWLFEELAIFAADEIVRLAKSDIADVIAYKYIPLEEMVAERFENLNCLLLESLKSKEFIQCEDGHCRNAEDVRFVTKGIRSLFSEAKHELQWVHKAVEPYFSQLKQIGGERLTVSDAEYYFTQKDYLIKQKAEWFIEYYEYLNKTNNVQFAKYPLIPLQSGAITSVNARETFIPSKDATVDHIKGEYFPKILTIRNDVYDLLKQKRKDWISRLELQEVSISGYFYNVVIPKIESCDDVESIEEKKKVVSFILDNWDEIETGYHAYGSLPVFLDDDQLMMSIELDEILVPEAYQEKGWEKVFQEDSEKSHFSVLNKFYLNFSQDVLAGYFSAIGVSEYPKPIKSEQTGVSELGEPYELYDQSLNSEFFRNNRINSTRQKEAEIPLLPSSFWKVKDLLNIEYDALVNYLNLTYLNTKDTQVKLTWFYRSSYYKYHKSIFEQYLTEVPWVKTTQGFRKPSECFVNDKNLKRIFGNDLPYVTFDAPEQFLGYLGVKKDADTSTIIDYLKELSSSVTVKLETVQAIYSALRGRIDIDSQLFSDHAIIYIPATNEKTAEWCTRAQVIWDDISLLTDDSTFKSLESHYTEELKPFFVATVGVKETIDASSYAELWLNLQGKAKLNEREWLLYSKAFKNIRKIIKKVDKPSWLNDFKSKAKLYTDMNSWVSSNDDVVAFLPDVAELRKEFTGKVPFIKRVEDSTYEWMMPLINFLDFECFSEVVKEELVYTEDKALSPKNRYLTDASIKLLIRLIANKVEDGQEILDKLKQEGLLASLFQLREIEIDQLEVKLSVPHTEISTHSYDHTVYLDTAEKILYVNKNADEDDIKDDLERLIITQILGRYTNRTSRESFEDSISKVLGVVSEKRNKKLIDKKPDWHIPKSILTFIDRVIKVRKPHKFASELQDQSGQEISVAQQNESSRAAPIVQRQVDSPAETETVNRGYISSYSNDERDEEQEINENVVVENLVGDANSYEREARGTSHFVPSGNSVGSSRPGNDSSSSLRQTSNQGRKEYKLRSKSSRSTNTASNINQARRNRLMSYVVPNVESSDREVDETLSEEQRNYRKKLGEKAELIVLDDLKAKGYLAQRMPENNPGYDIEARDPQTGEIIFVEVKGDSFAWSDKGVGISARQYQLASEKTNSYYLAIVDNLVSIPSAPLYIRDPVSYITEYRFDSGWSGLSTSINVIENQQSNLSVLEEMITFTDDENCKELIKYCDEMTYPLPEIGSELQDELGEVVLEDIELLWENEKIAVFITQDEIENLNVYLEGWKLFVASDQEKIKHALSNVFEARK
ncbi:MAG: Holliday junction resolvase-like predicted endonuclease [Oleispira sp.]|jgi:hypothetical protein|tara:strand:+ start:9692 stop:14560 length:4869 start_codon:yes stop_codon:yes gene_type:complete